MTFRSMPNEIRAAFEKYELRSHEHTALYRRWDQPPQELPAMESLTVFHSKTWIQMTLSDLAAALQLHTRCSETDLLCALVLCVRFEECRRRPTTRHMVHRLFVAALLTSLKVHSDVIPTNPFLARSTSITADEMCRLELHFALALNWRCGVMIEPCDKDGTPRVDGQRSTAAVALIRMLDDAYATSKPKKPSTTASMPPLEGDTADDYIPDGSESPSTSTPLVAPPPM
jgi:hypothetical protein